MLKPLTPKIDSEIEDLISDRQQLLDLKKLTRGPLHILFPGMMQANADMLRRAMSEADVDHHIFFAHKATKSSAFIKQAQKLGLGIDVASKDELCHSLASGYRGDQAECTGVKNDAFLQLAIQHKCLIVADSIPELHRIAQVKRALGVSGKLPVVARLSDVTIAGRSIQSRLSRFGIPPEEFGQLLEAFGQLKELDFHGFHFHNDERESDIRAGQLEGMLNLMIDTYRAGFQPTVINIGGGLRQQQLAEPSQWSEYIEQLQSELIKGNSDGCWRGFAYGMRINDRGKVVGRGQAIALCAVPDLKNVIREMFTSGDIEGKSNAAFIRDNGFRIMLEPGQAMLEQCGMSLFEVIEVKKSVGGHTLVVVDGNMYNLSVSMREYLMDPILISGADTQGSPGPASPDGAECFIVGSLCREEDFLMKRKVGFHRTPQAGDLICFANTAAYRIDFEDAHPHQQPNGMRLVATRSGGRWQFRSEASFDPYESVVEQSSQKEHSKQLVSV